MNSAIATNPNDNASTPTQAKCVVLGEHTLCYRIEGSETMLGVLAGSVQRGGHNWLNGPVCIAPGAKLRDATIADFDFYRVSHVGYL